MSQDEHKARAPRSVRCFIVTVSDTRTEATDTSGRAIADLLTAAGHVVAGRTIVKDEAELVRGTLERQLASADVQAIITTGGTGITSRDSTYEVVSAAAAEAARRIRRAVPDAELRADRPGRDDEPRLRRPRRRPHRRLAAGIGSGGAAGDGAAAHSRARASRASRRHGDQRCRVRGSGFRVQGSFVVQRSVVQGSRTTNQHAEP